MTFGILAVYPEALCTCFSLYQDDKEIVSRRICHEREELEVFTTIADQWKHRYEALENALRSVPLPSGMKIDAVIGPGGLLDAVPSGVYRVDSHLLARLLRRMPHEHPSNLGGLLAHALAKPRFIHAYIADPLSVDEMDDIAKVTGMAELPLVQQVDTLNIKAVLRQAASELDVEMEELSVVVAHLGKRFSICAHVEGRMVDVSRSDEKGAFSPVSSGQIPARALVRMAYSGEWSRRALQDRVNGRGGLLSLIGTRDFKEIRRRVEDGDEQAALAYHGMAYAVAGEIAAQAAVLNGKVDAVLLTGDCVHDAHWTVLVQDRIQWIAPVLNYPGEDNLKALAYAALRVLRDQQPVQDYVTPDTGQAVLE